MESFIEGTREGHWGRTEWLTGFLFTSPWVLGFLAFTLLPLLAALLLAFTSYDVLSAPRWVGLHNFHSMFCQDPRYWRAVKATVYYVIFSVPLKLTVALAVAMLFQRRRRFVSLYNLIYYAPSVVGGSVAAAVMWREMFSGDGLVNAIAAVFGIAPTAWLGEPRTAMGVLIMLSVWQFGVPMLIFLTGLRQIPLALYEAAELDGAGPWVRFTRITIPMLTPIIFFNLVLQIISGFTVFTQAFVITGGEPLDSTLLYSLYLYQRAFLTFEMGYSAAMALVLLVAVALVAAAFIRWSSLWVVYAPVIPTGETRFGPARKSRSPAGSLAYHVPVAVLGILLVCPILWVVANSFTSPTEIRLHETSWTLHAVTGANYVAGWRGSGNVSFGRFFANSLLYAGIGTIGAVFSSALVGYGFARFRFPTRRVWFNLMMLSIMLPAQVLMIPQYVLFSKLGWINTYYPLLVPRFCGDPFFILLIVQFILTIPRDLEEAAVLDGCGKGRVFVSIVLPLLRPVLLTTATFSFCWLWDDFLGPLVYLSDPRLHPVSVALREFADPSAATEWGALFAMLSLSLAVVLVAFGVFQSRRLVS